MLKGTVAVTIIVLFQYEEVGAKLQCDGAWPADPKRCFAEELGVAFPGLTVDRCGQVTELTKGTYYNSIIASDETAAKANVQAINEHANYIGPPIGLASNGVVVSGCGRAWARTHTHAPHATRHTHARTHCTRARDSV